MKLPKKTTAVTPHLTVRDVEAAARFYEKAFGFTIKLLLPGGRDGKIMHAEVGHSNCTIMIGPESPERGMHAPITAGTVPPVSLYVYVENVNKVHAQAVATGAIELVPPSDQFFGARTSLVADPNGHQWMLAEHQEEMSEDTMKQKLAASRLDGPQAKPGAHIQKGAPGAPKAAPGAGPVKRPSKT